MNETITKQPVALGTKTDFACPLCKSKLRSTPGCKLRAEGITLYCANGACPAQEVFGYGRDAIAAFKIITEKYKL